ncbi:MAG: cache domain-containing protein [Betaproteobacteria bacterium]
MRLKAKLLILAAVPLLLSLALIATAVLLQERELARREHALVEGEYMNARRAELRHYVDLGLSLVKPLADAGGDDEVRKAQAIRLLNSLDYGDDGYFFVYDMQGRVLMHSRQPDLVGQNLWELRDPQGRATIQALIAEAKAGGGYVEYLWRKPSTGQLAPKLGYVVTLPRWNWMVGTGLYLDDINATTARLDAQVTSNIGATLLWIAAIACGGVALISISGVWLNLSELRVADAKLQLLARQVVSLQEEERAHLARELHDGASQTLVSAKLLVESAVDELERDGVDVPASLPRVIARLQESLTEVRRISHRLRPAMLDTLGLPAALELLGREFAETGHTPVHVSIEGEPVDLPEEVKTALFRVSQEGLANIAKHARARSARIELDFVDGGVELRIADDGDGFAVDQVQLDPRRGIGLRNMRERMASIGGRFEVRASPGRGTSLDARVPSTSFENLRRPP